MKFKLVNIIGVDGSGKTTLARSLSADLKNIDPTVQYAYCQYFAKFLYPVKLAAKKTIMRSTDEFKDYNHYNRTKKGTSSRLPFLANVYACMWLIDYLFQVFYKVYIPVVSGKKLIIDRYIFDIAVNISLTTNHALSYAEKLINIFFKFAPKPDIVIFIDLPDQIAFSRKSDIQAVEYLTERNERYRELSKKYGFYSIDGAKSPDQVLNAAKQVIFSHEK